MKLVIVYREHTEKYDEDSMYPVFMRNAFEAFMSNAPRIPMDFKNGIKSGINPRYILTVTIIEGDEER